MHITVPTTSQFDFEQTVLSHGWYMLAPFKLNRDTMTLQYTLEMSSDGIIQLAMMMKDGHLTVHLPDYETLPTSHITTIYQLVRTVLNLDWDLRVFYEAMAEFDGYAWLEREQKGRILIAPTVWEDLAKVLFTTNTSWAQTVQMSARLCSLGKPHPTLPDTYAFPTAQTIAEMDFDALSEHLRAGYRTAYLYELAVQIADGSVDVESWRDLDGDDLYKAVKSLKGFGDYAAGTIVRMLGHFDKLAIDSACREMYATLHNNGEKGKDKDIKAHYARYGDWKGLVMWMDIMRR